MSKIYTHTDADISKFVKETGKEFFNRVQGEESSVPATEYEFQQIGKAITAALMSIREGNDFKSAAKTAEYFIVLSFTKPDGTININTHNSVYLPISWFLYLHGDKPEPQK